MKNRWGSNVNSERLYLGGLQNHCQETGIKTIPKKKKCKKAKWLSEEALQIAEKGREAKSIGEKERYKQLNAEFQGIEGTHKIPSSAINEKK